MCEPRLKRVVLEEKKSDEIYNFTLKGRRKVEVKYTIINLYADTMD